MNFPTAKALLLTWDNASNFPIASSLLELWDRPWSYKALRFAAFKLMDAARIGIDVLEQAALQPVPSQSVSLDL